MFKEIRVREIQEENKKKEEEGYKKIKPSNITYDEACDFWKAEFARLAQENNK